MASSNNSKSEKKIKNRETSKTTETKKKKVKPSEKENNQKKNSNKKPKLSKSNFKQQHKEKKKAVAAGEDSKSHVFPINRIRTIIKAEDSDLRVSHEAILAINKATEKFLEQFTKDAYASAVQDRKKSLSYNHLACVVSKQRRYDFLCDFVPEKVKAEDALRERNS